MTNYIIVQAINITILIAFGLILMARTRADFKRRMRELDEQTPPHAQTQEQRKLELRTQIDTLQRELNSLNSTQNSTSALRASD